MKEKVKLHLELSNLYSDKKLRLCLPDGTEIDGVEWLEAKHTKNIDDVLRSAPICIATPECPHWHVECEIKVESCKVYL